MTLPSLNPLDYPPRFQFGQVGAPCGGKSMCSDTCLQMMIEYWTEKVISLATIRKISKNPDACVGNNPTEIKRVIDYYKLPYVYYSGPTLSTIRNKAALAPVMVGVGYGKYPNKLTTCGSIKAEIGGRNDCNFRGAHLVLAIRFQNHLSLTGTILHVDAIMRDPDHGSAARPWKPHHDKIKATQLDVAMKALVTDTAWTKTFAFVPTRKKTL